MKKLFAFWLALLLALSLPGSAAWAEGFHNNVQAMNEAALSVYKLEAYSKGTLYATGSGFVAYAPNTMITNYHVIEGADKIVAISDNGERYELTQVLWADMKWDYAILVFPAGGAPLSVATSGPVRGGRCVAIGSPYGMKNTFSEGMVSGLVEVKEGVNYIQFNAPVSHGSSGGALFNDEGKVIGITQGGMSSTDNANVNYAVDMRDVTAGYRAHSGNAPIAIEDAYTIADASYQGDYAVGDFLYYGDLGVQIPANFTVYTYDGSIYMRKDDIRLQINLLDGDDLGVIGAGLGVLALFMNTNDLALQAFAGAEYGREFSDQDIKHPETTFGVEAAMISAYNTEYQGANKNVCMAMLHEDSTYMQILASSASGAAAELESAVRRVIDCVRPVSN